MINVDLPFLLSSRYIVLECIHGVYVCSSLHSWVSYIIFVSFSLSLKNVKVIAFSKVVPKIMTTLEDILRRRAHHRG